MIVIVVLHTLLAVKVLILINCGDLRSLEDGAFLAPNVIKLYTLHLRGTYILPELIQSAIHNKYAIMDPLQFSNLSGVNYSIKKLKRGVEKDGLMNTPYIFWPIPEANHWSLGIVCNEDNKKPRALHMDSADMHDSNLICKALARYMKEVLQIDGEIDQKMIQVPKQNNGYDCGILLLYYMKKIIEDFDDNFQCGREWYRPEDASALRSDIRDLIQNNKMKSFPNDKCSTAKKWASSFV